MSSAISSLFLRFRVPRMRRIESVRDGGILALEGVSRARLVYPIIEKAALPRQHDRGPGSRSERLVLGSRSDPRHRSTPAVALGPGPKGIYLGLIGSTSVSMEAGTIIVSVTGF